MESPLSRREFNSAAVAIIENEADVLIQRGIATTPNEKPSYSLTNAAINSLPTPLLPSATSNFNLKSPRGIAAALQHSVAILSPPHRSLIPPLAFAEKTLQAVVDFIGQNAERLKAIGSTPDVISDVVKVLYLVGSLSPSIVTNAKPAYLKALAAIAKLCRFGQLLDTQCLQNVVALGTAGACEAVVSTLQAYQNDIGVSKEVNNCLFDCISIKECTQLIRTTMSLKLGNTR
jgi:hypothetical protein